jgi:transcriptional regulator with XRE-family HTH domain
MSRITNSIRQIWRNFHDKEYRDGFIEDTIADGLAVQIQRMRQVRGWTQAELAEKAGTKQTGVWRWENSGPPASLTTLKKVASAFDVALIVQFVPFSEFLLRDGQPVDREIPSFSDDSLPSAQPISFVIRDSEPQSYVLAVGGEIVPKCFQSSSLTESTRVTLQ